MTHDEFEAWHAEQHPDLVVGCFACKVNTVQVSAGVAGNGKNLPPAAAQNSWERGIVTVPRAGGTEMPILTSDGEPMGVHEWASKRSTLEPQIRRDSQLTADMRAKTLQEA